MPRPQNEKENLQFVQELAEIDGPFESPININFRDLTKLELPPLVWNRSDAVPKKMKLTNTGHTVILSGRWNRERPYLTGGPLCGNYVFSQVHFHWGPDNCKGSEHTVCGEKFPLEMHVAHFKTEYLTQEAALQEKDGMLVLVYLFKLQDEPNLSLKRIINALACIREASSSTQIDARSILALLNPFTDDYFMYWGSVVTNTCAHILLWIICREPFGISKDQLEEFRKVLDSSQHPILRNNREPQPLHGRNVFHVNASRHLDKAMLPIKKIMGCFCNEQQNDGNGDEEGDDKRRQSSARCCCNKSRPQEEIEGNTGKKSEQCPEDQRGSKMYSKQMVYVQHATVPYNPAFRQKNANEDPSPDRGQGEVVIQEEVTDSTERQEISESCCFLPVKDGKKSKEEKGAIAEKPKKQSFDSVKALSNIIDSLEALKNHTYKKLQELDTINNEIKELKRHCEDPNEQRWLRKMEKIISRQKRYTLRTSRCCFSELKKLAKEYHIDKILEGRIGTSSEEDKIFTINEDLENLEQIEEYNGDQQVATCYSLYKQERFSKKAQKLIKSFFEDIKENEEAQQFVQKDIHLRKMSKWRLDDEISRAGASSVDGGSKNFITQQMFNLGNFGNRFFTEVTPEKEEEVEKVKTEQKIDKIIPLRRADVAFKFKNKHHALKKSSVSSVSLLMVDPNGSEKKVLKKKSKKPKECIVKKYKKKNTKAQLVTFTSEGTSNDELRIAKFSKRASRKDLWENLSTTSIQPLIMSSRKKKVLYEKNIKRKLDKREIIKREAEIVVETIKTMSEGTPSEKDILFKTYQESPERKKFKVEEMKRNEDLLAVCRYEDPRLRSETDEINVIDEEEKLSEEEVKLSDEEVKLPQEEVKYTHEEVKYPHEEVKYIHEEVKYTHEEVKLSEEDIRVSDEEIKVSDEESDRASINATAGTGDSVRKNKTLTPIEFNQECEEARLLEIGEELTSMRSWTAPTSKTREMGRLQSTPKCYDKSIQRRATSPVLVYTANKKESAPPKLTRYEVHDHENPENTFNQNWSQESENSNLERYHLLDKDATEGETCHIGTDSNDSACEKLSKGVKSDATIYSLRSSDNDETRIRKDGKNRTMSAFSFNSAKTFYHRKRRHRQMQKNKSTPSTVRVLDTIESSRLEFSNLTEEEQLQIISANVASFVKQKLMEHKKCMEGSESKEKATFDQIEKNVLKELKNVGDSKKEDEDTDTLENQWSTAALKVPSVRQVEKPKPEIKEEVEEEPKKPPSKQVHNFIKRNKLLAGKYKRKNPQKKPEGPKKFTKPSVRSTTEPTSSDKSPTRTVKPHACGNVFKPEEKNKRDRSASVQKSPQRASSAPNKKPNTPKEPEKNNTLAKETPTKILPTVPPSTAPKSPTSQRRWVPTYTLTSYLQAPTEVVENQRRKMNRCYFSDWEENEMKLQPFNLKTNDLEYLIKLEMCINNEIAANIENSMNYVKTLLSQDYNGTAIIEKPPVKDSFNIFDPVNNGILLIELNDCLQSDSTTGTSEGFYRRSIQARKLKRRKRRMKKRWSDLYRMNDSGDQSLLESDGNSDLEFGKNENDSKDVSQILKKYIYHLGRGEESNINLTEKDKMAKCEEMNQISNIKPHLKKRKEKLLLSVEMKDKLLEVLTEEMKRENEDKQKTDSASASSPERTSTMTERTSTVVCECERTEMWAEMLRKFLEDNKSSIEGNEPERNVGCGKGSWFSNNYGDML